MNVPMHRMRGWAALCLAAAAFALPCAAVQAAPLAGERYFPNVSLTTQDGRQVRFYDDLVKGKAVAVNIIYTSCTDVCPLETARLAEVQRLIGAHAGKDLHFYSITIDPARDTPQVLKAYARKFKADPDWLFLTGKKEDIQLLTSKLGLSRASDAISKDGHASSLMLGSDATGQWMRNSAVDNPAFLAATMANFFGWDDVVPTADYARATPLAIGKARFLFDSKCASCHTIGGGDRIGPDLAGVATRRSPAWLARYLKEPDKVLAEGDPAAQALFERYNKVNMPNLNLGTEDVSALLAYLAAPPPAPRTASQDRPPKKHQHHH